MTRKVARTLRDSCFAQLRGQIAQYYPDAGAKINKGDLWIGFPNGSEILFAGLDDVEKLKSIYDITGIWIEEASELEEGDFNQLDIRLRTDFDYYLQMILSFNPVSITHWLKRRFFDTPDLRAVYTRAPTRDNRFLTPEAVQTLEGFKDKDEYFYMVYCLGQWGVTGKTVFDGKAISERPAEDPGACASWLLRVRRDGGWRAYRKDPVAGRQPRTGEGLQEAGAGAALRHRRGHCRRRQ